MNKVIAIATVVALAFGGMGIALGATMASANQQAQAAPAAVESPHRIVTRTVAVEEPAPVVRTPEPAPRPSVAPLPAPVVTPSEASEIRVRRLVVTSAIEGREPADTIGTMSVGEHDRVYAFVELANDGGEGEVTVTFERDGAASTGHVELTAPAHQRRWRTWAFTRGVRTAGEWHAIVRDESGHVLADETFVVE